MNGRYLGAHRVARKEPPVDFVFVPIGVVAGRCKQTLEGAQPLLLGGSEIRVGFNT